MTEQTIAAILILAAALVFLAAGLVALRGVERGGKAAGRLAELLATGHTGRGLAQRRRRLATAWAPKAITVRLARADVEMRPRPLILAVAVAVAFPAAAQIHGGPWWAGAALIAEIVGVAVLLDRLAARGMTGLFHALPTYLENVRQLVAVGNSLQQAIEKAAEAAPPALRRHLRIPLHQLRHGASLGDSLETLADRLDLVELHMLAATVQASLRFGGRVSEVLGNLARVFRDRQRVERELLAATAETRFSALILTCLPLLVGAFLMATNAGYLRWFIDTPAGQMLLGLAVGLQVLGILVARWIVRVEY